MPCHFLLDKQQLPMMPTSMTPNLKPTSHYATNAMTFFVESVTAADDADFDAVELEAQIVFRH